jgi:hypothetical protein
MVAMDDWQLLFEYYVLDERFLAGVMATLAVVGLLNVTLPWVFKNVAVIRQFVQPPKKPPKQEEKPRSPLQQAFGCLAAAVSLLATAALVGALIYAFMSQG